MDTNPRKLGIPKKQLADIMKFKKKEGHNGGASVLLRKENKHSWEEMQGQIEERGLKKRSLRSHPTLGSTTYAATKYKYYS